MAETHEFSELMNRIRVLERRSGDLETALNENAARIQQVDEKPDLNPLVTASNNLLNGEFDMSRNDYLYYNDVTGTEGVDEDVSEECYGWFVSGPDTAVTAFGSMLEASELVTLTTPDFLEADETLEIVVEGAGTDGADLITHIGSYVSPTQVLLDDPAVGAVTNARVRWRLMTLVEDSTDEDADADQATNTTCKNADHTLYDTTLNDPDWDKENGRIRIGSTNWLCQPLRQNIIKPSLQYIISFIYRLSAAIGGEDKVRIKVFLGIWDNSPGKKCFLESDPVEINAEVIGSPAVTTSTEYFIVFTTNWGTTIGSEIATVLAPTTYTDSEYVGLSWIQPAGIIRSDIYRKRGSVVRQLNPPYPQTSYRDKGAVRGDVLAAFPAVDTTRSQAYMETTEFNFQEANTSEWILRQLNLPIPKTYDSSKTTDKQWFIIGLKEEVEDGERAIWFDRISLDDKPGIFARSAWDSEAKRNVSSQPQSADIGSFGGPIGPGDTDYCPVFTAPILVEKDGVRMEISAIHLVDNEEIYRIINLDGEPDEYTAEVSPEAQVCYSMYAAGRELRASENHPVFTDDAGNCISLKNLKESSIVLGREGQIPVESNMRLAKKQHTVKISLKGRQKGFWVAGIGSHNRKADPGEFVV